MTHDLGGLTWVSNSVRSCRSAFPDSLVVYRLAEPAAFPESAKQLASLASNMGLSGKPTETCFSDDWTTHEEGPFSLSIHTASGGITGRHRDRYSASR